MDNISQEELLKIMEVSGLSKNAIEKRLKMGQGTLGKFLTGKLRAIPDKYVKGIRKLGVIRPDIAIEVTPMPEILDAPCLIPDVIHLDERNLGYTEVPADQEAGFNAIMEAVNNYVPDHEKKYFVDDNFLNKPENLSIAIPEKVTVEKKVKRPDNSLFHLLPKI